MLALAQPRKPKACPFRACMRGLAPSSPLVICLLLLSRAIVPPLAADPVADVEEIRANLARAHELRRKRADEAHSWRQMKPELESLIALTKVDNESVSDRIQETEALVVEYASRLEAAEAQLQESETLLSNMKDRFRELDASLEPMVERLPERLREKGRYIRKEAQERLLRDDRTALRRGVEVYLDFLTELLALDGSTGMRTEIRTVEDGRSAEFTVIHLGLGSAFYVSEELGRAGRIRLSGTEWVWDEDARLLKRLLAVKRTIEGKSDPEFIDLPLSLNGEFAR